MPSDDEDKCLCGGTLIVDEARDTLGYICIDCGDTY